MERNEKESFTPEIESYEGIVPLWLIIVFVSLFVWGIYYLVKYWGGLGPGL
jgi:hypothetical protein